MKLHVCFAAILLSSFAIAESGSSCENAPSADLKASCICLTKSECKSRGGKTITEWSNKKFPCPFDDDSILGCADIPCKPKPGKYVSERCSWDSRCTGLGWKVITGMPVVVSSYKGIKLNDA